MPRFSENLELSSKFSAKDGLFFLGRSVRLELRLGGRQGARMPSFELLLSSCLGACGRQETPEENRRQEIDKNWDSQRSSARIS